MNTDQAVSEWLSFVNSQIVAYPRFQRVYEQIELCRCLSLNAPEPRCMKLEGPAGAGKTTVIRAYMKSFSRAETPTGKTFPILYMEIPPPRVTVKGVGARLLGKLEDPAPDQGTAYSMDARAVNLMHHCGVELVFLDDFHHVIDRRTEKVVYDVSEWLKWLIKEANIPFVVVGLEGKVDQVLKTNEQLSRLFVTSVNLHPLIWEPGNPSCEFANFVKHVEQEVIRLPLCEEVERIDFLERLFSATGGVANHLMNLLRVAGLHAVTAKTDRVSLALLSRAFKSLQLEQVLQISDPFLETAKVFPGAVPVATLPVAAETRSTRPKAKPRKAKAPAPSEILRAT